MKKQNGKNVSVATKVITIALLGAMVLGIVVATVVYFRASI